MDALVKSEVCAPVMRWTQAFKVMKSSSLVPHLLMHGGDCTYPPKPAAFALPAEEVGADMSMMDVFRLSHGSAVTLRLQPAAVGLQVSLPLEMPLAQADM